MCGLSPQLLRRDGTFAAAMEPTEESMASAPAAERPVFAHSYPPRNPEHELRDRAKAAKYRHKAAKARVKAKHLEEKARYLNHKADEWEKRADELDGVFSPVGQSTANE